MIIDNTLSSMERQAPKSSLADIANDDHPQYCIWTDMSPKLISAPENILVHGDIVFEGNVTFNKSVTFAEGATITWSSPPEISSLNWTI